MVDRLISHTGHLSFWAASTKLQDSSNIEIVDGVLPNLTSYSSGNCGLQGPPQESFGIQSDALQLDLQLSAASALRDGTSLASALAFSDRAVYRSAEEAGEQLLPNSLASAAGQALAQQLIAQTMAGRGSSQVAAVAGGRGCMLLGCHGRCPAWLGLGEVPAVHGQAGMHTYCVWFGWLAAAEGVGQPRPHTKAPPTQCLLCRGWRCSTLQRSGTGATSCMPGYSCRLPQLRAPLSAACGAVQRLSSCRYALRSMLS